MEALCCDFATRRGNIKDSLRVDLDKQVFFNDEIGYVSSIYTTFELVSDQLGNAIWSSMYPHWNGEPITHEFFEGT